MRHVFALTISIALSGCVSSVSTLQTARTQDPGKVELAGGLSVPVHGAFVSSLSDAVQRGADRLEQAETNPLTEAEERDLVKAAIAAVLLPPAVIPEVQGRVGIIKRVDVGLRWAGPAFKLDGKLNLYHQSFFDLSVSAGYVHHTGIGSSVAKGLYSLFEDLKLVEYSRHDLDAAVLASGNPERIASWYAALRYIAAFTSFETRLPAELIGPGAVAETSMESVMHYAGGTGGLRLGSPKVAFLGELTLMYSVFNPTILGERRHLGGVVVAPAVGLDVRF